MLVGATPANKYFFFTGVFLRHPVMFRQLLFNATSTFPVWVDRPQTGHAYSPMEKQNVKADIRSVCGQAPQVDPVN